MSYEQLTINLTFGRSLLEKNQYDIGSFKKCHSMRGGPSLPNYKKVVKKAMIIYLWNKTLDPIKIVPSFVHPKMDDG